MRDQEVRIATVLHQQWRELLESRVADAKWKEEPLFKTGVTRSCIHPEFAKALLQRRENRLITRRSENAVAAGSDAEPRVPIVLQKHDPVRRGRPFSRCRIELHSEL